MKTVNLGTNAFISSTELSRRPELIKVIVSFPNMLIKQCHDTVEICPCVQASQPWKFHSSDGGRGGKSGSCSIMPVSRYNPGLEIMEPVSAWERPMEGKVWTEKGTGHLTFILLCLSHYNQSFWTWRLIMLYPKLKNNIYVTDLKPLG